ncbi:hypothetical protein SAMN04488508_11529 [Aquimarina spongiae]|uniref:Uncharacterized protein n=1 Tax=Aquimarina spongiae TaxID=570521 RepID=A0A1M6LCE8_9FLAO|nr:hypothetical protein SAMN04488508_11529 [Aquimarina spongiae]
MIIAINYHKLLSISICAITFKKEGKIYVSLNKIRIEWGNWIL